MEDNKKAGYRGGRQKPACTPSTAWFSRMFSTNSPHSPSHSGMHTFLAILLQMLLLPVADGQSCGVRTTLFVPTPTVCDVQLTAPEFESPWGGRAGGKEGGNGLSEFAAPDKKPNLNWNKNLSPYGTKSFRHNSPIFGGDGTLYFASISGHVFGYDPSGILLFVVDLQAKIEGVPAMWGNVLLVASDLGLHGIDTRRNLPPSVRKMFTFDVAGGVSSSPVVVNHEEGDSQVSCSTGLSGKTACGQSSTSGATVYFTGNDQYVYKLGLVGTCNGLLSEPCTAMFVSLKWREKIEFTDKSEPLYTWQDVRCTAPYSIDMGALRNLKCVQCKKQLPCDKICDYCEDQTIGGFNPIRSSPVLYEDTVYVLAWDGMHALQRVDGSRKWDYFLPFESKVEWNERFYVGSSFQRQRLMALSCVVVSDYVIFPSGSKVVCLNRGDGTLKWQIDHQSSYDYISTPVLYRYKASSDGVDAVLVSSRDGTLHCLDIRTGTSLWKYGTGVNSLSAPALAPVVDSYSNIFILEKDKLTALDRDGARLWYEESCAGEGIYSSAAISREGMIAVACNDSSVRLYCCRKCEVSEPVPYAGSVFQGNNTGVLVSNKLAVNITLRHRMVWKNLRVMPMCRMGSSSWPAQRITSSLLQCEIPTLEAILDDHNSFSIALKQHTLTYKRCFANTSTGMIQVPCSYIDESEAFLPACRDRIKDSAIQYSNMSASKRFCNVESCVVAAPNACTKMSRLDIDLSVSYIGNESCVGSTFTYYFPILVVKNDTIFPAKLPKNWGPTIINIVISGVLCLVSLVIYIWAKKKLNEYLELLEDQKVEEMAAYLNSPDLDPKIKRIVLNAKYRLQYCGNGLVEAWAKWKLDVESAHITRIFLMVGQVKTQILFLSEKCLVKTKGQREHTVASMGTISEDYDKLTQKFPDLRDSDKLWTFVWSQHNKGHATWLTTRRIMDILTTYSPYWGDLWSCYLEIEIEGFREKFRKVRQLRSHARRGETVWTRNHDFFESQRQQSWQIYHTHSLTIDKGFSSVCRAVTKFQANPTTSVALGAPLSQNDQDLTFVYFGESGSVGIGIAHETIPLQITPHETGRSQAAWYYTSGVSGEPYSNVTGEIKIIVVAARNLRNSGRLGFIQRIGMGLGMKPFVQLSIAASDDKDVPREWKTATYRGLTPSFPKWNDEEFRICLRGNESALRVEVLHDSRLLKYRRPMNLGSARIPLNLMRHASCESWVPISNGTHSAGDYAMLAGEVLIRTSYSVPIEEMNVLNDEKEAKYIFQSCGGDAAGKIEIREVCHKLTQLGYSQEKVDEMMYLSDRRCLGKISYVQYWNAVLPHIFENRIRDIASTIHPIFRSDAELPELEPLTPPPTPPPQEQSISRAPSTFSRLPSISRLPSTASIKSAVSQIMRLRSLPGTPSSHRPGTGSSARPTSARIAPEEVEGDEDKLHAVSPPYDSLDTHVENTGFEGFTVGGKPSAQSEDEFEGLANEVVQRSLLFYALGVRIARALLRHATHIVLQPGEHLCAEDEEVKSISVVRSGSIVLYRAVAEEGTIGDAVLKVLTAEGTEPEREAFAHLGPGDIIGEAQCLQKELCSVFFRAETKTRILQIPRRDIMQMLPRKCREFFDPPAALDSPLVSPIGKSLPPRPTAAGSQRKHFGDDDKELPSLMYLREGVPLPPEYMPKLASHKSGGAMYEGARCVAKNLPSLKSGDRMRIKVDRGFGLMRFWINDFELKTTISGFQGEVRPMVFLTGKGSSCTIADRKERVIRLVLVAAEGLPRTDFLTGLSDPYVKVHLTSVQAQGGNAIALPVVHSYRTRHISCSLTPEWNESFILTPHNLEDRLDIEVWDYDVVDEDDLIGTISCHIADIIHHCDGSQRWYKLRNKEKNAAAAGKICLRFEVSQPNNASLEAQPQPGPKLFRKMTYQADARMRRPRLKDLPDCLTPDPAFIRSLFQRCFMSKLTVPQIRYFFDLWANFEAKVLGASHDKEKFAVIRDMVWRAFNAINAKHPHGLIHLPEVFKDESGNPDMEKTPRIWLAMEGAFKHRKTQPVFVDEKMHRMNAFRAKGTSDFLVGKSLAAATGYQRNKPLAGSSLFLAPGALSGLMRPPVKMKPTKHQSLNAYDRPRSAKLRAVWVRERPSSAKPKTGHRLHFAEGPLLQTVRQTASLGEDADDVDKNVLDAGWGESEEQATICFRSAMQDDRGQTGQSTDKRRVSMRPGSGIVRPVSSRPRSGKSRPDTRGILKSQASVRSIRFDKYVKNKNARMSV